MLNDQSIFYLNERKSGNGSLASMFLSISVFLFLFLILFIPSFTRYWAIMLLAADLIYVLLNWEKFKINVYIHTDSIILLWVLFITISFGGLAYTTSTNLFEGLQFIFTLVLFLLNFILLTIDKKWIKFSIKLLLIITTFFLIGTLLQIIFPDLLLSINQLHLSDVLFEQSLEFYRNGNLNGFTYQTLQNGLLISMLMGIVFSQIYKSKNISSKILLWGIYFLLYYLLLMTDRRSFILFTIVILFFLTFKLSNKKKLAITIFLILLAFVSLMLIFSAPGRDLLNRTFSQQDITSGRLDMIKIMWNDFLESPFLGNGTYTTINVVDYYHGHNIYFQVLRENGIIGFVLLISLLLYNFIKTNIKLKKFDNHTFEKQILILSLYYQLLFMMIGFTENALYDTYSLYVYVIAIAMSTSIIPKLHVKDNIDEKF